MRSHNLIWIEDAMDNITPLPAGSEAPDFTLTNVITNEPMRLADLRGQPVILNFWSVECPWSRKFDDYFLQRAVDWAEHSIWLLFIDSNDNEAVYDMQDLAEELGIAHPVLQDKHNLVADVYGALTTPHIFLLDSNGLIVYQGAVDDRSFRQPEATINYLDAAVESLIEGKAPTAENTPAYGCAIMRHFED
jgi:peroxiredoxin